MGKRKILILVLVAILAMTFSGGSYAWGRLNHNVPGNPGAPDVKFISANATDNEVSPVGVGDVTADITGDRCSIEVTITNAYPGYKALIEFELQNVGKLPARIKKIKIKSDKGVKIWVNKKRLKSIIVYPDGSWSTSFGIMVDSMTKKAAHDESYLFTVTLKKAAQDTEYRFTVTLNFVQAHRPRD